MTIKLDLCQIRSVQYVYKNYSTYTNSIPTCDRKTELAGKKNLHTLRKEIYFEYDRKVELVVNSVQYSTYTKTILCIPTVYQIVTANKTCSQKKLPTLRKENNLQT